MDEKSNPPPLSVEAVGGGGARALDGTKIRAASEHEPVEVLVCMCVCAHTPHVYFYEADTSITYSSVLSAGLPHCVCLTIIMPHALFNTHADSDAHSCRDIYLRYTHLSPGTFLPQTVAK